MLELNFRTNIKEASRDLDVLAYEQVPFATALALTAVGRNVAAAETANIAKVFPTATPFTLRALAVIPATKARPWSQIVMKDITANYLAPYETEGSHVPWKGQRAIYDPVDLATDQYGNIPRSTVRRLLNRKDVFLGKVGNTLGIWQRPTKPAAVSRRARKGRGLQAHTGQGLKLLVYIAAPVQVTQRLGYHELAARVIRSTFDHEFRFALARALATRK